MNNLKQKQTNLFVLVSLLCCFGLIQPLSSQVTMDSNNFSTVVMQSTIQPFNIGSIDSLYNSLLLKLKTKFKQFGIHATVQSRKSSEFNNESDDKNSNQDHDDITISSEFNVHTLKTIMTFIGLLFYSSLSFSAEHQEQDSHCFQYTVPCISSMASNGLAVAVDFIAPTPIIGCVTGSIFGGIGGLLEGISSNTEILSQKTIHHHRSFCPSYVSNQFCVSANTCWNAGRSTIANASAGGAIIGYTGCLLIGQCLNQRRHNRAENQNDIPQINDDHQPVRGMPEIERVYQNLQQIELPDTKNPLSTASSSNKAIGSQVITRKHDFSRQRSLSNPIE